LNDDEGSVGPARVKLGWGVVLGEALVIAVVGIGLALVANTLSPRGLVLGRDYFPGQGEEASERAGLLLGGASERDDGLVLDEGERAVVGELEGRLAARGYGLVDGAEAEALFQDARHEQELVMFVDARNARRYASGHVPGAYHLDPFYPEAGLGEVLPVALMAEMVIIYCTGGDCEDSEFGAVLLEEAGVPAERLYVYGGGWDEWRERGLPVETGQRRSGVMGNETR
jgi:rhodanese-related sulfurtransferase